MRKRQVSVASDTTTSQENLDLIEHEMETRLNNLRRELVRRSDNSLVGLREEIHNFSEFFGGEISSLRQSSQKGYEPQISALERKVQGKFEELELRIQTEKDLVLNRCTKVINSLESKISSLQSSISELQAHFGNSLHQASADSSSILKSMHQSSANSFYFQIPW